MTTIERPGFLRHGLLAAAVAMLAACATAPEIRQDVNPAAEFTRYKTFAFHSPLSTDHRAGYETVLTSRLKESTRRMMESKGYVYGEASADLLVNFYANVQTRQEVRSWPSSMGYYGYRYGWYGGWGISSIETVTYREGTLAIDVVEARRRIVVWQGTAVGTVTAEVEKNPSAAIDATVTQMMAPLPAAGGR
jgi:hypothetical protein